MGAKQKKHACWGHKIRYLDIIKQKKKRSLLNSLKNKQNDGQLFVSVWANS
jgi:hypothetical protein